MPPLLALRLSKLLSGVFLYGFAMSLMVRAGLGVAPWDVLNLGLVRQTGLSFGTLTVLIGVGVLLLWWPLRQRPGLGTVLNALLVGPSAQFGLWLLPDVHGVWQQVLVFGSGLLLLALATGLYIGARFGPGPRDGLMTGLHARTGWPVWAVRSGIEGSVLLAGWWMGGTVGLGTLAFALLIGPLVGRTLPWCETRLPPRPALA
ncbi:YczE/YyaS/YitT family protein [Luteimonas sp. SDU82]|uniref:membrane protein YczE n=1 Tax=Luteimonas sp. SDU82 TaxID=3422592 RepID=UPI003EBC9048